MSLWRDVMWCDRCLNFSFFFVNPGIRNLFKESSKNRREIYQISVPVRLFTSMIDNDDTLLEDVEELAFRVLSSAGSMGTSSSSSQPIPRLPLDLERRAFGLARKVLLSAGSMISDDVAPAYYRFQQKELQQENNISPYHAPAFTLTMVEPSNPVGTTIHRPETYKQSSAKLNKVNSSQAQQGDREKPPPIDPRLTIGVSRYKTKESSSLKSGKTIATSSPRHSSSNPGPSDYGDLSTRGSKRMLGGVISKSSPETELERIIRLSGEVPGPSQYETSIRTRYGRATMATIGSKFGNEHARGRGRSGESTPGAGEYETQHCMPSTRRKLIGTVSFGTGTPGDRFDLTGDEKLNEYDMSFVDIQHYQEMPIIWRTKTGHCIDVAEKGGDEVQSNNEWVGPQSYPAEIDGAIGRSGRLGRAGKRSMPSACFHRPMQNKATNRRPLHVGIFERLAKSAMERVERVNECERGLARLKTKEKLEKKKKRRRRRARMTHRAGSMTKL